MRIIAGKYKGVSIKALTGDNTRPTTDRVREAWASSLISLMPTGFEGLTVLDAFAGSGALGIEALSRGAAHAVFCEKDPRAHTVLKQNIATLNEKQPAVTLFALDVFLAKTSKLLCKQGPYHLIVLDPPYNTGVAKIGKFLQELAQGGALLPDTWVSYEHKKGDNEALYDIPLVLDGFPVRFSVVSYKIYGTMQIDYLCLL